MKFWNAIKRSLTTRTFSSLLAYFFIVSGCIIFDHFYAERSLLPTLPSSEDSRTVESCHTTSTTSTRKGFKQKLLQVVMVEFDSTLPTSSEGAWQICFSAWSDQAQFDFKVESYQKPNNDSGQTKNSTSTFSYSNEHLRKGRPFIWVQVSSISEAE